MERKLKLWRPIGGAACASLIASAQADQAAVENPSASIMVAQGGEGGEAGIVPGSYELLSRDPEAYSFKVDAQVQAYADLVFESYQASLASARKMQKQIEDFLALPSPASMAASRTAWRAARPDYLVTEVFRFYDGPIDQTLDGEPGPEFRINAWPLNEAHIDSVQGQPESGLVWNSDIEITRETILAHDQVSDESDVTTGWHAIEFLLWGQDLDPDGPGQRPYTDYLPGETDNDRRRTYLSAVTELLIADLETLSEAWAPDKDNYRKQFLSLPGREALGRAINGAANLVGHELAVERLAVALDSGDQEDEHSCFSDTTHRDHLYDLRGAYNVWRGTRGGAEGKSSIRSLLMGVDPAMARQTDDMFVLALATVASMDQPFDSILRTEFGSPERQRAERAVTSFQRLSAQLARVGKRLGVLVIVPGIDASAE